MPDLKDERLEHWTCASCGGQWPALPAYRGSAYRCSTCVAVDLLRANVAADQAARERAQQALREIEVIAMVGGLTHLAAIARRGLGETP